ncbi:MAG: hypothetical protein RLZZ15_3702, partial [Verrucomicrobiota bacterium]
STNKKLAIARIVPPDPAAQCFSAPRRRSFPEIAIIQSALKNGQPISGAVNNTLSFPSLTIADAGDYTVRVSNGSGSVTSSPAATLSVSVPYYLESLNKNWRDPEGLAYDAAKRLLYIAESGAHRIYSVNLSNGAVTLVAGSGSAGSVNGIGTAASFRTPSGLALNSAGTTLYVTDTGNHAVRQINLATGEVSNLVGRAGTSGYTDGIGNSALFNLPFGLAVATDGTVYVSDFGNHVIRAFKPADSRTSTIAGNLTGLSGSTDGPATSSARFRNPAGLSFDSTGSTLYIADFGNHTIRKLAVGTATVSTFAGAAGLAGLLDGTGTNANFNQPRSVTVTDTGNVYVTDANNAALRKITSVGVVSLLAGGFRRNFSSADGIGSNAVIYSPGAVLSFKGTDLLFVSDAGNFAGDARISLAAPAEPLVFTPPESRTSAAGTSFTLTAEITSPSSLTTNYQWFRDGTALTDGGTLTGTTQATLGFSGATPADSGSYTLRITNAFGTVTTAAATITITGTTPPVAAPTSSRLINLSILTGLSGAGDSFTLGYVVGGDGTSGAKPLVIRAAGPSLGALGVPGTLEDPKLELFAGSTKTGENDNWGGGATLANALAAVGAFPYTGPTSRDAAIATSVTTRDNSVKVTSANNGSGTVIAEIYDATPAASSLSSTPRLVNLSVLKHLGTGLTAGFVIGGSSASKTVLIRTVGPTLGAAPFGIPGVVADPQLTLFGVGAVRLAANDNWGGTPELSAAFAAVGAFALPAGSRDAALVATLAPGNYTVEVKGVANTTGLALIEVYELSDLTSTAVLRGAVRDALTGNSLNGVSLAFTSATGASLGTVQTALLGEYSLNPPPGPVTATVTANGYIPTTLSTTAVANITTQVDTVWLSPNPTGTGTISGRITNALTGRGLGGVTPRLRSGVGFITGTVLATTTTNASGDYAITGTPAGTYTAEISLTNFVTAYFTANALAGRNFTEQNAAISPVLAANELRFVLTWGAQPVDLDTYLFGPNGNALISPTIRPTTTGAVLDVDDRTSFGPETLTVTGLPPGTYEYAIWNYSDGGIPASTRLSNVSGAQVRVFQGSTQIASLNVPTGKVGNLWIVFQIDGASGKITTVNTVSQELGSGIKPNASSPGAELASPRTK